jgi:DNA-binding HxlR family transcriptional regulator
MGDKWKVLIIRNLLAGTKRFGELKNSLSGISQKVLTQHLRALERNGIVRRKVFAEVPPKVEYSLSDIGHTLRPIHDAMWKWGEEFKAKAGTKTEHCMEAENNEKTSCLFCDTQMKPSETRVVN